MNSQQVDAKLHKVQESGIKKKAGRPKLNKDSNENPEYKIKNKVGRKPGPKPTIEIIEQRKLRGKESQRRYQMKKKQELERLRNLEQELKIMKRYNSTEYIKGLKRYIKELKDERLTFKKESEEMKKENEILKMEIDEFKVEKKKLDKEKNEFEEMIKDLETKFSNNKDIKEIEIIEEKEIIKESEEMDYNEEKNDNDNIQNEQVYIGEFNINQYNDYIQYLNTDVLLDENSLVDFDDNLLSEYIDENNYIRDDRDKDLLVYKYDFDFLVCCKFRPKAKVGFNDVERIFNAASFYNSQGVIITNTDYSPKAQFIAKKSNIILSYSNNIVKDLNLFIEKRLDKDELDILYNILYE
ncbi:5316_t:CDS:2 [Scutellospora calospora]|uniref:5316_t:CDS:1 n=1 Tax=Scutellospora calospora TaxID=85575 RepID=A0ACA9LSY3_9GLOM|nr:5316_t:CDS:2 [Scutellospora calospora]